MKRHYLKRIMTGLFLVISGYTMAQRVAVSGYISDAKTGEALPNAVCIDTISMKGVAADAKGYFTISVPQQQVALKVSYMGYETQKKVYTLRNDTIIGFEMVPSSIGVEEVVVKGSTPDYMQTIMGKTTLSVKEIKSLPAFLGETDVIKSISMLPGISLGREGYSNIYVRGGDRGQNLILLDGMKLYNTNYVGGFVSALNSDVINNMDVYKGGFPARYGGRASSVIDITTIDGNIEETRGKYTLGILTTGLLLEGPATDKLTYFISGRTSFHQLTNYRKKRAFDKHLTVAEFGIIHFYDFNAKINWRASTKSRFWASTYIGQDKNMYFNGLYNDHSKDGILTGNIGAIVGNTYILSPRMYLRSFISHSSYKNQYFTDYKYFESPKGEKVKPQSEETSYTYTQIKDITAHTGLTYNLFSHTTLRTGAEGTQYWFVPSQTHIKKIAQQTNIDTTYGTKMDAYEVCLFAEVEHDITKNIGINLGLRASSYTNETTYNRLEPRISFRWLILPSMSFKAGYTIINQFNHVVVNNDWFYEKEICLGSTPEIGPQRSEQTSAGMFFSLLNNKLELSTEGYYKKMSNLLEYSPPIFEEDRKGYDIFDFIETGGTGEAYGTEIGVAKKEGKYYGGLAYTLSWNFREFENINNGKKYPSAFDRRHDLSIYMSYDTQKKYSFHTNFSLSTGRSFTMPLTYINWDEISYEYTVLGDKNNQKFPLYHRLDLSFVKKGKTKKLRNKEFKFNIYNVYAQQNPMAIKIKNGKVYKVSMFTILPSFAYSVYF